MARFGLSVAGGALSEPTADPYPVTRPSEPETPGAGRFAVAAVTCVARSLTPAGSHGLGPLGM